MRVAMLLVAAVLLVSMSPLAGTADPLAGSWLALRGWSGGAPLLLGWIVSALLMFALRRLRRWRRTLWFLAGIIVGVIPLAFYASLHSQWSHEVSLAVLAVHGLIGGAVLGVLASWYVSRRTQRSVEEWQQLP